MSALMVLGFEDVSRNRLQLWLTAALQSVQPAPSWDCSVHT